MTAVYLVGLERVPSLTVFREKGTNNLKNALSSRNRIGVCKNGHPPYYGATTQQCIIPRSFDLKKSETSWTPPLPGLPDLYGDDVRAARFYDLIQTESTLQDT